MSLRVASWNIWGRYGDFRSRHAGIASALRSLSPDLVGLVETWWDDHDSQIQRLADELGYPYRASAQIGIAEGAPWGVGVLSRLPIVEEERIEFENRLHPQPPGVALVSTVEAQEGLLDFVCMCEWGLAWSPIGAAATTDRTESYRKLTRRLAARRRKLPPILVGDLNAIPEAREIRALTGKEPQLGLEMTFVDTWESVNGVGGGWTWDGLSNPHLFGTPFGRHRIDYVLTGAGHTFDRMWRAESAEVFGTSPREAEPPPSDHYGVLADLVPVDPLELPDNDYKAPTKQG